MNKTMVQGDVWAPYMCATSIDSIGKECLDYDKYLYRYTEKVKILTLTMMDDVCTISTCGVEALKSNSFLNYKISTKKSSSVEPTSVKRCT